MWRRRGGSYGAALALVKIISCRSALGGARGTAALGGIIGGGLAYSSSPQLGSSLGENKLGENSSPRRVSAAYGIAASSALGSASWRRGLGAKWRKQARSAKTRSSALSARRGIGVFGGIGGSRGGGLIAYKLAAAGGLFNRRLPSLISTRPREDINQRRPQPRRHHRRGAGLAQLRRRIAAAARLASRRGAS